MNYEEKIIEYPPVHPGTDRTFIRFYEGEPNPKEMLLGGCDEMPQRVFVTDTTVSSLPCMEEFTAEFGTGKGAAANSVHKRRSGKDILVILDAGEPFKTIESVLSIVAAALDANGQRSTVFVGIGGGVITDMTAFAASIFKRGARCELVPTTLLSMVDAAVGGKTGCDFGSYKNMIGSFFPAQKIHICPEFIKTLPQSEYRSGLAEVVKTALLFSAPLFDKLESNPGILDGRGKSEFAPLISEMIRTCVSEKASVVEQDLTEKGMRMLLNLGHTFGHALETCAGLGKVARGDGVAWGMARAADLSERLGLCTKEYAERVKRMLRSYTWETSEIHPAMEGKGSAGDIARTIFGAMKKDKKNSSSKVRFVLQRGVCDTVITEADEGDVLAVLGAER